MPDTSFTLAAFVRELARAWQRLSMYQEGHPARHEVAVRMHAILVGLVAPTGAVALGVTKDSIIGAGERVSSTSATRLAEALYTRHVAVVRFEEGIGPDQLETFLGLLPRARASESETPLWEVLEASGVTHVKLEPIDFSALVGTDDLDDPVDEEEERGPAGSLWESILQRLLSDEQFGGFGRGVAGQSDGSLAEILSLVERVMERHGAEAERAISGGGEEQTGAVEALSALSGLLGEASGSGLREASDRTARKAAARHVAELLGAIPEVLRESVLDSALAVLVGVAGAADGFEDLAGTLSAAQVVASLRRLRGERVAFSPRVLGLLDDLVIRAAPVLSGDEGLGDPEELAKGLRQVFGADDIDRVLPTQEGMDRLAMELRRPTLHRGSPEELDARLEGFTAHRQLIDLAQVLLDLLSRPIFSEEQVGWIADRVEQVVQALLASGRLTSSVRLVQSLEALVDDPARGQGVRKAAVRCLDRLERPETVAALIESLGELPTTAIPVVHQLIELTGGRMIHELLVALSEEKDLARRRHTFNLLASLGPTVAPHAVGLLDDERWYVKRNILSLLRQIGEGLDVAALRPSLEHHDNRVRLEAVKCLGAVTGEIPTTVLQKIIVDEDQKVAETAATMVGAFRLPNGYEPLIGLLRPADPLGRRTQVRVKALHALGKLGRVEALDDLSHFFRSWFAVVNPEERRAAFESLAGYPTEARRALIKKGLRSPDGVIRTVCRTLEES